MISDEALADLSYAAAVSVRLRLDGKPSDPGTVGRLLAGLSTKSHGTSSFDDARNVRPFRDAWVAAFGPADAPNDQSGLVRVLTLTLGRADEKCEALCLALNATFLERNAESILAAHVQRRRGH